MSAFGLSHLSARLRPAQAPLIVAAVLCFLAWAMFPVPLWAAAFAWVAIAVASALGASGRAAKVDGSTTAGSPVLDISPEVRALLAALPHPAFVLDADGTVRFANPAAELRFPATRAGDTFTATFRAPELRAAVEGPGAEPGGGTVVDYREPGRSTRAFTVSISDIGSGAGRPWRLIIVEDVSERLAVARMRADFVANASHELRTPLSSITGFIETLLGPARNDPAVSERFLRIMQEQAGRMRRLIDDLLSLSRAEMREHRVPTEKVDPLAVVREAADTAAALAAEHGVRLDLRLDERPVTVLGDRDELLQVFGNLLENAIRYGASGGRVELGCELRSEGSQVHVAIHVQDFGPGIPEEHLPRLTERFYRVDVGASREMKGTGLGLAIVKHILTRHGARLTVESRIGKGARFTVLLPVLDKDAAGQQNR